MHDPYPSLFHAYRTQGSVRRNLTFPMLNFSEHAWTALVQSDGDR